MEEKKAAEKSKATLSKTDETQPKKRPSLKEKEVHSKYCSFIVYEPLYNYILLNVSNANKSFSCKSKNIEQFSIQTL